jgi:hypothetical protein
MKMTADDTETIVGSITVICNEQVHTHNFTQH